MKNETMEDLAVNGTEACQKNNEDTHIFSFYVNGEVKRERLSILSDSFFRLNNYKKLLSETRKHCRSGGANSKYIAAHLADKAYAAESDMRTLLKAGLDSLNEIKDFGLIDKGLSYARENWHESFFSKKAIGQAWNELKGIMGNYFPDIDTSFLVAGSGALNTTIDKHKAELKKVKSGLLIKFNGANDKSYEANLTSVTGIQSQRVTAKQFFSDSARRVSSISTVHIPDDCHHHLQTLASHYAGKSFDYYGSMVGQFALLREMMYNHARKIDQYGMGYLSGNSEWWEDLIIALACIVLLIIVLAVGGSVQVSGCQTQPDGSQVCGTTTIQQSQLTVPSSSVLIIAAMNLAGISCATLEGGCNLQVSPVLSIAD